MKWSIRVTEVQHVLYEYIIEADTKEEAIAQAENGENDSSERIDFLEIDYSVWPDSIRECPDQSV